MQGYGEKKWTKSKMIPIRNFVADFDPNYITWESYKEKKMNKISEAEHQVLLENKAKLHEVETGWRKEYNKKFQKQIENFIS